MKDKEEWRDIPGYEGYYQVSSHGRVRSLDRYVKHNYGVQLKRGLVISSVPDGKGYLILGLSKNNKRHSKRVHVLVAMSFLGHKQDGAMNITVDHIDNNKLNNYTSNLQLITSRENNSKDQWRHNRSSKYVGVTWDEVRKNWKSQIKIKYKNYFLGRFKTELDASEAYQSALKEL